MTIPPSTQSSIEQKLDERRRARWPQLARISVRFRTKFAYIDGVLSDGEVMPLCRLRYGGSATFFGFAIAVTRGGRDAYEESVLPTGAFEATPQDALDCACGLYLEDPTAWLTGGSRTSADVH